MRTAEIELAGRTYPLCFSLRSMCAFFDRYGSMDGAFHVPADKSGAGDTKGMIEEYLWQLRQLLEDGKKHAELDGLEAAEPPALEAMYDLFGVSDLSAIQLKIAEAIAASSGRTVGAAPGKNAETTQGDESN